MLFYKNPNEFETAFWYPVKGDRVTKKAIGVEIAKNKERRFNTLSQNIVLNEHTAELMTSSGYAFKIGQELQYRNRWYIIRNVSIDERAICPQAMAFSNYIRPIAYLDLVEEIE